MKPTCIFCGGSARQTKEHAIPQWLGNLKPVNVSVRFEGEHRNLRKWDVLTDKVELKVGGVCAECNSGWMSRLEGEVKPLTVRFTYRGNVIRIYGAGYWRKGRKIYEEQN